MKEELVRLAPREQQIAELLLQGCDNEEIGKQLNIARRTVKAHFNRLFLRFGIQDGVKRVKLATLLYRRQLCSEASVMENGVPANESSKLLSSSPKDSKTAKSQMLSEPQSTLLKTTSEPSMTSSDSGTESNLLSGTKPEDTKSRLTPDALEQWERSILDLDPETVRGRHIGEG
jgi:hypothetical protein